MSVTRQKANVQVFPWCAQRNWCDPIVILHTGCFFLICYRFQLLPEIQAVHNSIMFHWRTAPRDLKGLIHDWWKQWSSFGAPRRVQGNSLHSWEAAEWKARNTGIHGLKPRLITQIFWFEHLRLVWNVWIINVSLQIDRNEMTWMKLVNMTRYD